MRICYATDIHGSERHYRAIMEGALQAKADLLLLGGDLCPDFDSPSEQVAWVDSLREWLAEHLRRGGCPVAAVPGNHDTLSAVRALRSSPELTMLGPGPHPTLDWLFVGFSLAPPSPYGLKDLERLDVVGDEAPGLCAHAYRTSASDRFEPIGEAEHFAGLPTIQQELQARPLSHPNQTVFVCHAPPAGGVLDRLPGNLCVGSRAIRAYVQRSGARISLHGHIHESPFEVGYCGERIGATWAVNPGQQMEQVCWCVFDPSDIEGTWQHSLGLPLQG